MRALALGLVFSVVALPCLAQTVLKSEPLVLAPYEVAFVQDASCPVGKVLKVTGAIRGLHRRKTCVALAAEQASLAIATPEQAEGPIGRTSNLKTRFRRRWRIPSINAAGDPVGRRAPLLPCCGPGLPAGRWGRA